MLTADRAWEIYLDSLLKRDPSILTLIDKIGKAATESKRGITLNKNEVSSDAVIYLQASGFRIVKYSRGAEYYVDINWNKHE